MMSEIERLNMQTKNLAEEKLKQLKELFPNAVTEIVNDEGEVVPAIDKDVLMQEISSEVVEGNKERYQFTWPNKREAVLAANAPTSNTLRPCREESVNFDETENLYIEGDNLEVLKQLQETYLGKVKMIYIDPPYNTGKDFVYKDDFKSTINEYTEASGQYDEEGNRLETIPETHGRFHTDWLNMMYPRLKLARNLLSEDGAIFISIDDNEHANLRKISDEVFGKDNLVVDGVTIVKTEGRNYGSFAKTHENFLAYAKDFTKCEMNEIVVEGKSFKFQDKYGGYNIKDLRNGNTNAFNSENRPNLRYPFYVNERVKDNYGFSEVSLESKEGWIEVYPIEKDGIKSVWRWGSRPGEKAKENIHNICSKLGRDGNWRVYEKQRSISQKPKTVLIGKRYLTSVGTDERDILFEKNVFDFPKPTGLIKEFLEIGSHKDSLIMDFFSGSSTTADSVMQLNAADNGKRKYIMVQLPEETDEKSQAYKLGYNYITDIGKERIRRSGQKILEENKDKEGIEDLDIGFRVLKLDSSNMKDVYYTPEDTDQNLLDLLEDNIKEDRTSEDLLFQMMLELGIPLSSTIEKEEVAGKEVLSVEGGFLVACFDKDMNEETVKAIAERKPYYAVFRDSSMADDSVATNFNQIFESTSPETIRRVV